MPRIRSTVAALLVALALLAVPGAARAQQAESFTLAPGATAIISFEAFCTNFGAAFPDQIEAPNALAPDPVRGSLAYIRQFGLGADPLRALEGQYGLWRAIGATDSPPGSILAGEVLRAAQQNVPAAPAGTSLLDAAQAGQVTVRVTDWQAVGEPVDLGVGSDNFYGRGTLVVENVSGQELTLYHPIGALYPPSTAGEQTMAAYATNIQTSAAAQAAQQATSQPTTQPTVAQPTSAPATAQPTVAQPTSAPATAQPTAVQPTARPPVVQPTAVQPTARPPVVQPTAVQPTARPPVVQPTAVQPTTRPVGQAGQLPQTSALGGPFQLFALLAAAAVAVGVLRRWR